MTPTYLAGAGLACALGPDLRSALAALPAGAAPRRVVLSDEVDAPVHALWPDDAQGPADWLARARRDVTRVAAESGALGTARDGPLFIASSSRDIGLREQTLDYSGDIHSFSETVAGWLDWRGPVFTVSTACTSAVNAVLSAMRCIGEGEAQHALVLGLELPNRFTPAGFAAMQLMAPERAEPFGAGRAGLVIGEAVAALHLSAAPARWRIAGGANVVDGRNPAGTEASALAAACREALARSGLQPADIDLLKPHAAASPANDAIEAEALKALFGRLPPLVSLKAAIGHTLGAAGAVELALLTGCIAHGAWPGLDYALDPALDLRLAEAAPARVRRMLLASVGFGGGHAALVVEDTA